MKPTPRVYPPHRQGEDKDLSNGIVVPAGGGKQFDSPTPGRFFTLKLLGRDTGESIMMFEETLPAGTASLHHTHHHSDEVAWVPPLANSPSRSATK